MKGFVLTFAFVLTALFAANSFSQSSMSSWPFFTEVTPGSTAPNIYQFVVPLQVMDKAQWDLWDLRLYDARGHEIPYAIRIRREVNDIREIDARLFNQATVGNIGEVSLDLGENPGEHNEVEIATSGSNFRRRVTVEGSDSGKDWAMLKTGDVIFSFASQNTVAESDRISYPLSRYRYLRLKVSADEVTDSQAPSIELAHVKMAQRAKGELTKWSVAVPGYQLLRNQNAPASAWTIDLGARVPCDRLAIGIEDRSFSRPFQLENVDDPQNVRLVASGELTRRVGEANQPLVIKFDNEEHVRKLRLLTNDYNNPTLAISSIEAAAPARQLIFELKEPANQPLKLFFGNENAIAPHYDFESEVPATLAAAAPIAVALGPVSNNSDFKPRPLPLTERVPWLIYIVLAVSSLALALILFSLARATLRMALPPTEDSKAQTGTG